MSRIRFQVVPPIDRCDEPVFISGSLPALGDWQTERGPASRNETTLPRRGNRGRHRSQILNTKSTAARGKAKLSTRTAMSRQISPATIWLDATLHHTVAEWKDRYHGRLTRAGASVACACRRSRSSDLASSRVLFAAAKAFSGHRPARRSECLRPAASPYSGVDWAADEWVSLLSAQGVMPEAIVVGVCHPEGFSEENETLRDFDLSPQLGGAAYAQFLVTELIPHLDTHYRTLAEPSARVLGGRRARRVDQLLRGGAHARRSSATSRAPQRSLAISQPARRPPQAN